MRKLGMHVEISLVVLVRGEQIVLLRTIKNLLKVANTMIDESVQRGRRKLDKEFNDCRIWNERMVT